MRWIALMTLMAAACAAPHVPLPDRVADLVGQHLGAIAQDACPEAGAAREHRQQIMRKAADDESAAVVQSQRAQRLADGTLIMVEINVAVVRPSAQEPDPGSIARESP